MITVNLNRTEFEYDIHSLLKAFFPKEDVEIYYTKEAHAEEKNVACTNHSAENETESASHFSITYEDKQISITCTLENKKPAECTFAVDFADRAETKNALKENLYHLLEEVTGQSLPWGTLTGIRMKKWIYPLQSQSVSVRFFRSSIIKMDTACISAFHFAQVHVCIARLLRIRWQPGKSRWMHIWMRWRKKSTMWQ